MKTLVLKAPSALSAPLAGTPLLPAFDPSLLFSFTKAGIVLSSGKVTQWTNSQGVEGASGNLLQATAANAPTAGADGVVFNSASSQSLATAGLTQKVAVPALTVITRIKFSAAADSTPGTIFSAPDATGFAYLRRMPNGTLNAGLGGVDQLVTTAAIAAGTYADVAVVFDGANSRIYINDVLAVSGTTDNVTISSFRIGANASNATFLNAEVKQLNAYTRALTAAEIAEIRATFA